MIEHLEAEPTPNIFLTDAHYVFQSRLSAPKLTTYVRQADVRKSHFWALSNVVLYGVSRNPEQSVVTMYTNVVLISDTFKPIYSLYMATAKVQIRRLQLPHYCTAVRRQLYYTRKLSYRKDDRAMRPIYGCPEKNFESPG